jgi:hypothetical protein
LLLEIIMKKLLLQVVISYNVMRAPLYLNLIESCKLGNAKLISLKEYLCWFY